MPGARRSTGLGPVLVQIGLVGDKVHHGRREFDELGAIRGAQIAPSSSNSRLRKRLQGPGAGQGRCQGLTISTARSILWLEV